MIKEINNLFKGANEIITFINKNMEVEELINPYEKELEIQSIWAKEIDEKEQNLLKESSLKDSQLKEFTREELKILENRNLFADEYSLLPKKEFAKLDDEQWNYIKTNKLLFKYTYDEWKIIIKRELLTLKNADKKTFSEDDIAALGMLDDFQWSNVISEDRKLLTLKNADNKAFRGYEIAALAKLNNTQWDNVISKDRKLLTLKDKDKSALAGTEIAKLAELNDIQYKRIAPFIKNYSGYKIRNLIDLAKADDSLWDKIEKRELFTLKNADNLPFKPNDIAELAKLDDLQWDNVVSKDRNLLTLKNADKKAFSGHDIAALAKLDNSQWSKVISEDRKLLTLINAEKEAFSGYDISALAKLDDTRWKRIQERNLINNANSFSTETIVWLSNLDTKEYESISEDDLKKINKIPTDLLQNLNKEECLKFCICTEIIDKFHIDLDKDYVYNQIKQNKSLLSLIAEKVIKQSSYGLALLADVSDEEYEKENERLHGKMSEEVKKQLDEFKKRNPEIKLMVDNDVSAEKMKQIIDETEEFINYQKKAGLPFAKTIQFTKSLAGIGGFYYYSNNNKIHVNLDINKQILGTLTHENGHLRDDRDMGIKINDNKYMTPESELILAKVLSFYGSTKTREAIAELAKAIETPDDKDDCEMTKKIRLREDENGNQILMIAKDSGITNEETKILGSFFRKANCPEMIPDYKEEKHGSMDNYYETIIRNRNLFKEKIK